MCVIEHIISFSLSLSSSSLSSSHSPLDPSRAKMLSFISPALFIFLSVFFQHLAWAISLRSTGQTLILNDIPYYVPGTPFATIPFLKSLQGTASAGGLVPVTVVRLSASNASFSGLERVIGDFEEDDVWNEGFLEGTSIWRFGAFAKVTELCGFNSKRHSLVVERVVSISST